MTEPLLRQLQARGQRVTVGALPWVAPVYRAMASVAEVLEFPFAHGGLQWSARRALARSLRGRFDSAVVCPNSFKSALLPWWAGIPERIGYQGEARYGLLTKRLPNPDKHQRPPMADWYAALAGAQSAPVCRPQMQADPAEVAQALAAYQLSAHSFYVLVPGAEYGPAKRWPSAHFATLAQQLAGEGRQVWLLGGAGDQAIGEAIVQASQGAAINLCGQTDLASAIDLMSLADQVVSNDSGLMHVAAALGRPQVALYGSSSAAHTPPLNPAAHLLMPEGRACSPCFARVCPLGHFRCMNELAPARVMQALRQLEAP